MCSTNLGLGSLGGLADVVDMIENQGVAKIEDLKRLFLVTRTGDVFLIPTLPNQMAIFESLLDL